MNRLADAPLMHVHRAHNRMLLFHSVVWGHHLGCVPVFFPLSVPNSEGFAVDRLSHPRVLRQVQYT